jgi:hypothetical protein
MSHLTFIALIILVPVCAGISGWVMVEWIKSRSE